MRSLITSCVLFVLAFLMMYFPPALLNKETALIIIGTLIGASLAIFERTAHGCSGNCLQSCPKKPELPAAHKGEGK